MFEASHDHNKIATEIKIAIALYTCSDKGNEKHSRK